MTLYFIVVQSKVLLWKQHYRNAEVLGEATRTLKKIFKTPARIIDGQLHLPLPALPEDGATGFKPKCINCPFAAGYECDGQETDSAAMDGHV